jgi:oligosaccharide repeat unit polymerase
MATEIDSMKGYTTVASAVLAVGLCFLYSVDVHLSVLAGVLLMAAIAVAGVWSMKVSALSLLPRLMLLLYSLPFAVLAGSLILSELELLNAVAVDLIFQKTVAADALAVGCVGLLALIAGQGFASYADNGNYPRRDPQQQSPVLSLPLFALFVFVGVVLSAVSSSANRSASGTYFEDALEAAEGGGAGASLYVISYSFLIVMCIDAQSDQRTRQRQLKAVLLISAVAYMTVFHQLLQGDREILGLIIALLALHITRSHGLDVEAMWAAQRRLLRRMLPLLGAAILLFLAVGQLRYVGSAGATEGGLVGAAIREIASGGTWTAVFLGNLGLANEHQSGAFNYYFGKTYIDYLLSLPPGIVSNFLGLDRPLQGMSGPGLWYYPLQWGGVHPVVVPFKNFGIWGVFAILVFYGWLIGRVERSGQRQNFWSRVVYGTFFAGSFNWFWYGDMPFLRALMAAGIVGMLYRLTLFAGTALPRSRPHKRGFKSCAA